MFRIPAVLFAALISFGPALAESHDSETTLRDLPEACRTAMTDLDDDDMMSGMKMPEGGGPAMMGYGKAIGRMHGPMAMAMRIEDPDLAFACGMIPHHQGAIDMAKTVQENGKDEQVKAMAQKMIDAQTAEISELTAWIEGHAAK